jgi:hypothetical protein
VAGLEGESSVRIFGKAGDEVFEVRDPGGYSVKCIVVAFRFGMIVVRPVLSIPGRGVGRDVDGATVVAGACGR